MRPWPVATLLSAALLAAGPALLDSGQTAPRQAPAVPAPAQPETPPTQPVQTPAVPTTEPVPSNPEDGLRIEAPLADIAAGSAFFVTMPAKQNGPDLYVTPDYSLPEGAVPPAVLPGEPGKVVYLFAPATAGEYRFAASWQVSLDKAEGPDRHGTLLRVITVTAPQPPPSTPPTTPTDPQTPATPTTPVTDKATAATYVYEKSDTPLPPPVLSALNRLNRERKILATALEADVTDGTGEVPDQYKAALAAAKQAGLPALVVTAGEKVLAVVKDPKTEQAVLDAVPK